MIVGFDSNESSNLKRDDTILKSLMANNGENQWGFDEHCIENE